MHYADPPLNTLKMAPLPRNAFRTADKVYDVHVVKRSDISCLPRPALNDIL